MIKGSHHTKESVLKSKYSHLGQTPWNKGKKGLQIGWNKGKKCPQISEGKIAKNFHHSLETIKRIKQSRKGKGLGKNLNKSRETTGDKNPNWRGGLTFEIYPRDWNDDLKDSVRKRDNFICQECGIHQDELDYKLDCHHIDYDKKNCNPNNLISLCRYCHIKTNYGRDYWKNYFLKVIIS